MARTLPWLVTSDSTSNVNATTKQTRQERPKTPKIHNPILNSSPPPIASPRKDKMSKKDEAWIMVEDELLSTAQTFTRSLHINEDRKRRSLATRRAAETLNNISRPTDPRAKMSAELRIRKSHENQEVKTQKAFSLEDRSTKRRRVDDSDSDSNVPIGDRNLAGLMRGSRQQRVERKPLDGLVGAARRHDSQLFQRAKLAQMSGAAKIKTKEPVRRTISTRPYDSPPFTPDDHSPHPRSPVHLTKSRPAEPLDIGVRPKHSTEEVDKGFTPDDSDIEERPKPRTIRRTLGKKQVDQADSTSTPAKLDLDAIPFFDV